MMSQRTKWFLQLGSIAALLIVSLQNCGDFRLQGQLVNDKRLFEVMQLVDSKVLPRLLDAEEKVSHWKISQGAIVNKNIFADQASIVVAVDRLAKGSLVSVYSGSGSEEVSIRVEGNMVQAVRSNLYGVVFGQVLEGPLPSSGEKMVIAASFGAESAEMSLLINGIVQRSSVRTTGTPFNFSYLRRQLSQLPDPGKIVEVVVYAGDSVRDQGHLTLLELNSLSRYVAASSGIPYVAFDPTLMADVSNQPGDTTAPSTAFLAAKAVFDSKCLSCHSAGSTPPLLSNLTESIAIGNGWVVKGRPDASPLYYRLKNSVSGPGPRDMPQGMDLSAQEAQAVADWIQGIQ